jgi:hypothetical protein
MSAFKSTGWVLAGEKRIKLCQQRMELCHSTQGGWQTVVWFVQRMRDIVRGNNVKLIYKFAQIFRFKEIRGFIAGLRIL